MKSIDQISLEVLESGYDNALDAIRKGVVAGVEYGLQRGADLAIDRGNHDLHHAILALIPKDSA